jgi:hypothetical protein
MKPLTLTGAAVLLVLAAGSTQAQMTAIVTSITATQSALTTSEATSATISNSDQNTASGSGKKN